MTASVGGGNVAHSPTYTPIKRDIYSLLDQRELLLTRAAPDPTSSHMAAISLAIVEAQILCWLISHVPRNLLAKAACKESPRATTQYKPDVVSHPSETIRESLEAQGKDWLSLHTEGGLMKIHAVHVVRGTCHITPRVAEALEAATNVPARFWLNRQSRYDAWRKGAE